MGAPRVSAYSPLSSAPNFSGLTLTRPSFRKPIAPCSFGGRATPPAVTPARSVKLCLAREEEEEEERRRRRLEHARESCLVYTVPLLPFPLREFL